MPLPMSRSPRASEGSDGLTSADRRYETFVRPVPLGSPRVAHELGWRGWAVHVETVGDTGAAVRLLLVHGAGGNAAAMWPFAAHLASTGAEVTVVDLPGYGRTRPSSSPRLAYRDWRELLLDLVEAQDDGRPLIVVGASMGGMLALDTAARSHKVSRVVVTCLLDLSDETVRRRVLRAPWMSRVTGLLRLARGGLRGLPLPIRWITPLHRISNHPGLAAAVRRDRRGGGSGMPLGWYADVVRTGPVVSPENHGGAPVLLLHPGEDRWTPTEISRSYLDRLPVPVRYVELPGAGHFPIEEPGVQVLLDEVRGVVDALTPEPRP